MKKELTILKFPAAAIRCFALFAALTGGVLAAEAEQLLRYDFAAGSAAPSFTAENVAGSSAAWTGISGGFSSNNNDAYVNTTNTPAVYDRSKYLTFTITAADGCLLNPESFSFQLGGVRGGSGSDLKVQAVVRTDADLYASTMALNPGAVMAASHTFGTPGPTYTTYTADLNEPIYQGLKSLTFRLYGYDSISNSGVWLRYDSLTVSGAVVSAGLRLVESDVCVYGGTSGGAAAAVQAARMGKSVTLLSFGKHLGGMSSGGLGETDQGSRYTIGGISREFYRRVGAKYGADEEYSFEPHVAEEVFEEMTDEAGVNVFYGQRLASVTMDGNRIKEITMDNGTVYRAGMFIDTSYEGDLMAKAGVSYTVGREANSTYGETVNGVIVSSSGPGGTVIDPYNVPGDSSSGLIPMVQPHTPGPRGSADELVQAYNFRMCLTQATNRIPIAPPADYDPANYELLARYIAARTPPLTLESFMTLSDINNAGTNNVNIKTDTNNRGGAVSTDYVTGSWNYSGADHAQRMDLWHVHEDYMRGFFHFLATDSRVPENVRTEMQNWGLAADEFTDNGGWPNQLYVREARRMVSDYVMTEWNSKGTRVPEDSIGLASYPNDSHTVARVAVDGTVRVDGGLYVNTDDPYPISYRSIVPRVGECANLFTTFALSGSHVAFSSIRMEPVFMITSQSAATAACQAMDDGVDVQQVDYTKLAAQLMADGQVLVLASGDPNVVDNADTGKVQITGTWTTSTADMDYGATYLHDQNALKGTKSVRFIPDIPSNGNYGVSVWWASASNRSTNTPIDVIHAAGTNTFVVNQELQGGQWVPLGTFAFNSGTNGSVLVRTTGTEGYVIADAVRFIPEGSAGVTVELWANDGAASEPPTAEGESGAGSFTVARTGGNIASPLTVQIGFSGTASNGIDYASLPASVIIPSNATSLTAQLIPLFDTFVEGAETASVHLVSSSQYDMGTLQSAEIAIADRPYHAWKHRSFDSDQLEEDQVSGDEADPDGDGISNRIEAFFGTDPLISDKPVQPIEFLTRNGKRYFTFNFSRAKSSGFDFNSEVTGSLLSGIWDSGPANIEELLINDDGQNQTIRVRDLIPAESATNRFMRIRVWEDQ